MEIRDGNSLWRTATRHAFEESGRRIPDTLQNEPTTLCSKFSSHAVFLVPIERQHVAKLRPRSDMVGLRDVPIEYLIENRDKLHPRLRYSVGKGLRDVASKAQDMSSGTKWQPLPVKFNFKARCSKMTESKASAQL